MKFLKIQLITFVLSMLISTVYAQDDTLIPIQTVSDSITFKKIIKEIKSERDALFVFDVDNTLIITNENSFGSDWWYTQTKKHPELKLNISNDCLFGVLTPLFYSTFNATALFDEQPQLVDGLGKGKSKTIAVTSRSFTPNIAASTEFQLTKNGYTFLETDSATLGPHVILKDNVVYTRGGNKGEILLDYVKKNKFKKIYFFDDSDFKTFDVQKAFSGTKFDINIYHMTIAPKVPYTEEEMKEMEKQLCNLIDFINTLGKTPCECND